VEFEFAANMAICQRPLSIVSFNFLLVELEYYMRIGKWEEEGEGEKNDYLLKTRALEE